MPGRNFSGNPEREPMQQRRSFDPHDAYDIGPPPTLPGSVGDATPVDSDDVVQPDQSSTDDGALLTEQSNVMAARRRVMIPLQGPDGANPKAPSVPGWQSPSYKGVNRRKGTGWCGMRTDDLVVVDIDSEAALDAWKALVGEGADTWVRKTPHGIHFIYAATPGSPTGPMVGVFPDTDIRAGHKSQIVFHADGYSDLTDESRMSPFDPAWLPVRREREAEVGDWSKVPEGRRNITLAAFAGTFRKQGMDYHAIRVALRAMNKLYCEPQLSNEEVEIIAQSVAGYTPDPDVDGERLRLIRAVDLGSPRPVRWLLEPYVLSAELTLVEGREGTGKGLFCAYLAAMVAKAGQRVIWFSAEDSPRDTVVPRLRAAGVGDDELANVAFQDPEFAFGLPSDVAALRQELEQGDVGLVIFDPVKSYGDVGGGVSADSANDIYVRKVMTPLSALAQHFGVPVVVIGHWNKSADTASSDRSHGSVAWRAVSRAVMQLARRSPADPDGAIWLDKCNVAPCGHLCDFSIEEVEVSIDDLVLSVPRFVMGEPIDEVATLDAWLKSEGTKPIVVEDPDGLIEEIIRRADTDGRIAKRDEIQSAPWAKAAFCHKPTDADARKVLKTMNDSGRIELRKGRGNFLVHQDSEPA